MIKDGFTIATNSGTGNGSSVIYVPNNNTGAQRSTTITVRSQNGNKSINITLKQLAPPAYTEEVEFYWTAVYQGEGSGGTEGDLAINIECRKISDNSLYAVPENIPMFIYLRDDDNPGGEPFPLYNDIFPAGESSETFRLIDVFENVIGNNVWCALGFNNVPVGQEQDTIKNSLRYHLEGGKNVVVPGA